MFLFVDVSLITSHYLSLYRLSYHNDSYMSGSPSDKPSQHLDDHLQSVEAALRIQRDKTAAKTDKQTTDAPDGAPTAKDVPTKKKSPIKTQVQQKPAASSSQAVPDRDKPAATASQRSEPSQKLSSEQQSKEVLKAQRQKEIELEKKFLLEAEHRAKEQLHKQRRLIRNLGIILVIIYIIQVITGWPLKMDGNLMSVLGESTKIVE